MAANLLQHALNYLTSAKSKYETNLINKNHKIRTETPGKLGVKQKTDSKFQQPKKMTTSTIFNSQLHQEHLTYYLMSIMTLLTLFVRPPGGLQCIALNLLLSLGYLPQWPRVTSTSR